MVMGTAIRLTAMDTGPATAIQLMAMVMGPATATQLTAVTDTPITRFSATACMPALMVSGVVGAKSQPEHRLLVQLA